MKTPKEVDKIYETWVIPTAILFGMLFLFIFPLFAFSEKSETIEETTHEEQVKEVIDTIFVKETDSDKDTIYLDNDLYEIIMIRKQ